MKIFFFLVFISFIFHFVHAGLSIPNVPRFLEIRQNETTHVKVDTDGIDSRVKEGNLYVPLG